MNFSFNLSNLHEAYYFFKNVNAVLNSYHRQ